MINENCKHFTGYKPCKFQKENNAICDDSCEFKEDVSERILIIKKGAMGEVIRCTPLLRRLKKKGTHITWITDYPELLNPDWVDSILKFNYENCEILKSMEFDTIYNLDKDLISCALSDKIYHDNVYGYYISRHGKCKSYNNSNNLYLAGIDDEFMKCNKMHYVEMLFGLCDMKFNEERYILPKFDNKNIEGIDTTKKTIGLNTGCSATWATRKWSFNHWLKLIGLLVKLGYYVILFGGKAEHEKNTRLCIDFFDKRTVLITEEDGKFVSPVYYEGIKTIPETLTLMNKCSVIVTGVTFGLHIAIGLEKKIVLINNIINKHEF